MKLQAETKKSGSLRPEKIIWLRRLSFLQMNVICAAGKEQLYKPASNAKKLSVRTAPLSSRKQKAKLSAAITVRTVGDKKCLL